MKFKHLLSLASVVICGTANAQVPTSGAYYIQNVESGLFLAGNNSWGTQASLCAVGDQFAFVAQDGGVYNIVNAFLNPGNKTLGYNLYVDTNTSQNGNSWTIEPVKGKDGVFTIYGAGMKDKVENNFDGYLSQSATKGDVIGFLAGSVNPADASAEWRFVSHEELVAQLKTVAWGDSKDATFLLLNAGFTRNHATSAWVEAAEPKCTNRNLAGGANNNMCAESYHSPFKFTQTIDVPNGVYGVTAQGFVRGDGGNVENAMFFANEATQAFPVKTGEENSMTDASNSFAKGAYTIEEMKVTVTNGKLEVGVKNTDAGLWCIWDNFQLTYYGVDVTALQETLAGRIKYAQGIAGDMNAATAQALADALADVQDCPATEDALAAAITEINNAISAAEASIEVYKKIVAVNEKAAALTGDEAAAAYATVLATYTDKTATEVAPFEAAYLEAVKVAGPGSDITAIAPTTWVGQSGAVPDWACPDMPGAPERYNPGAFTGDVMTMTLNGLKPGTYVVTLRGGASYTPGRGFEGGTGQNRAYLFANDALQSMEVYERTEITAGSLDKAVLTCGVKDDGVLKMGIENKTMGANWFVINLESIIFESADLPTTEVELAVGSAQYSTFIAPFDAKLPTGVKAYTVTGIDTDNTVVMEEQTAIAANTPVVLFSESEVSEKLEGVSQAEAATYTVGLLTGVYAPVQITEGYVLQNLPEDGVAFYVVNPTFAMTVPANKAYLTAPSTTDAKVISFGGEATAIKAVGTLTSGNAKIYDVNGRELKSLQKGINIVNGVKVLVK